MNLKLPYHAMLLVLLSLFSIAAAAIGSSQEDNKPAAASVRGSQEDNKPVDTSAQAAEKDKAIRLEGEKRFHSNCSRCHAAPPKFPPRMMGTIIRHMRVRAVLTDDDTRFILRYMTQ